MPAPSWSLAGRFAVAVAILLGPGCAESEPSPGAALTGSPAASDSGPEEELGVLPQALEAAHSPALQEQYGDRDAGRDAWPTEAFGSLAAARLHLLAGLLAAPEKIDRAECDPLVTAGARIGRLRPAELDELRDDAGLRILSGTPGELPIGTGASGLTRALSELCLPVAGHGGLTAEIEVVEVELEGDRARTRVVYQAHGRAGPRPFEANARWDVGWELVDGMPPRIATLAASAYEEALGPEGGALFAEVTPAALGATRAWREQLAPSLDSWAGRIGRTLGMSLIGHEGLALGDVNGDGLEDLYVCQPAGLPNLLFVRRPDGTAVERAASAGLDFLDPSRGALLADLDGDGDQDLAVDLDPRLVLLAGDGAGAFQPRLVLDASASTSLTAADYDLDGDLDLYVCGYVLPDTRDTTPLPYHDAENGRPNRLFRNDGERGSWAFVDVTAQTGLDANNRRFSFAASWEDFDDDGDPDLYVANDYGRNNLYRNDGGRFTDVAAEAGVEDMAAGMGVAWADFDRDGDMDLHVSNMSSSAGERVTYQRRFKTDEPEAVRGAYRRHARGNSLFVNRGDGTFTDVSESAGITRGRWAWGAVFSDLDGDGWRDLFVPNGFVTGDDPEDL